MCRSELTEETRGGRQRLGCVQPDCRFVHWDNPIPVVAAIVEREERIVLVRSHGWPQTWYALVTGFLEANETPEAAVLREVEEEIGIPAELGEYVGAYPFELLNQIIFVYHVRGGPGPIRLCDEELADYKEVPIAKVRPWPRGTGPALREWLAARGYHPPTVELGAAVPDDRDE
jgi:NAD+ diphosphatase